MVEVKGLEGVSVLENVPPRRVPLLLLPGLLLEQILLVLATRRVDEIRTRRKSFWICTMKMVISDYVYSNFIHIHLIP